MPNNPLPALAAAVIAAGTVSLSAEDARPSSPRVVFVAGDHEYRSEESLPMLARLLKDRYGFEVAVCYPLNENGKIDPLREDSISGLQALENADLMVMYTRFRRLPEDQLKKITAYVDSGRPVAGFRTTTHAFRYPDGPLTRYNNEWAHEVFGQQWISHHGHFDDGDKPLTEITEIADGHPVTRGIGSFSAYSWLYHVEGPLGNREWKLSDGCETLVRGRALRSNHGEGVPKENPVAWVREAGENRGRLFFTTLGHPYDFRSVDFLRLTLQGLLWAAGREDLIPEDGIADLEVPADYKPNNSGMSKTSFKPGLDPVFLPE